ncbi:MAG: protein-L-isoaspartate(D-aspartate) O-methyltransferase [Tindallia sp. MSAO_Bac2]|nr:MAG: protein-L-isoaspartate(D-aspartate) O-methyltransferase [Tindallia sp. MSAO_Bac2]
MSSPNFRSALKRRKWEEKEKSPNKQMLSDQCSRVSEKLSTKKGGISLASLELLIKEMKKRGMLKSPVIEEAFRNIDRRNFVPANLLNYCYEDRALPIGYGQTISQPSTVAFMLQLLSPQADQTILDVGSGSCWTTALLAYIVGIKGRVIALERIQELVDFGCKNLEEYPKYPISLYHANATEGWPAEAPYDRILVSASAKKVPEALLQQLKIGGIMVIPLRDMMGNMMKIEKLDDENYREVKHAGFAFVPFVEE